ncbi:MAG: site-2 protease family protein [Clostridiales bacterium]|nr:site-2 protease family protein [Clostridiales bacterium]
MTLYELFVDAPNGRCGLLNVLAFVVALLAALVLHELAHGLVALWNGDNTAKIYGRLTLNPIKHFDWVGLVLMFLVGFGWAKPVPVNPNNFKDKRIGAITVSIAGISTNIILAFFAAMFYVIFWNISPQTESAAYAVYFFRELSYLILSLNVAFALFNLLPLYPLDGYRLLSCFIDERNGAMMFLRRYSLYIMLGFIVFNSLSNYIPMLSLFSPLNWYLARFGGLIQGGFYNFWRLIFNG